MRIISPLDNKDYKKADNEVMVFLGGSCDDKKDWRKSVISFLESIEKEKFIKLDNLVIVNPFIKKWNPNEDELKAEIEWESSMIDQSDIYSCYLYKGSDTPITMFELGKSMYLYKSKYANSKMNHRIIVTAHPDYEKTDDLKYELAASTKNWKCDPVALTVEKNVAAHASKILEAYLKFSK